MDNDPTIQKPRPARSPERRTGLRGVSFQLEQEATSKDVISLVPVSQETTADAIHRLNWWKPRSGRFSQGLKQRKHSRRNADLVVVALNGAGEQVLRNITHIQSPEGGPVKLYTNLPAGSGVNPVPHQGSVDRSKAERTVARRQGIPAEAYEPAAKAKARLRGLSMIEEDLRRGEGTFDLDDAITALRGISRQAIAEKVRKNQLLAVPGPGNQRRYPAFQFEHGGVIAGLAEVLAALPSQDPWFRLNWLVNPEPRLGNRTPVEVLREGKWDLVVEAARRVGEMGT